jgi:FkbM family methyltransferase
MTFLFIVKQKKNVDTFLDVIAYLLSAGHRVVLTIQQRGDERDERLAAQFASPLFELVRPPDNRGDHWRATAPLVRSARDAAHYTRPAYQSASKLRQRALDSLLKELGADRTINGEAVTLAPQAGERLRAALEQIERLIPSDALHEEFLARHAPDVVIVTPGVHFGSVQSDFIKSAQARGIPVWMLLFSWDNLSSKGALHVPPDLLFVWNERQRQEARDLHDYPPEKVIAVGAPRFDEFFQLRSHVPRDAFFRPLGLDPSRPTLLYVCSSRFIASQELPFIQRWLEAVRAAPEPLRSCNVIVRPHPDLVLVEGGDTAEVTWPAMPRAMGWVQRPFDDPRAIVLRTTYSTQQAFYECVHHSAAVVGLNTSAELEAGIVGRPVLTVVSHELGADGQTNTLHFNYLLREHGGFVECAPTLRDHIATLTETLAAAQDPAHIRQFISAFLRPCGDQPVSPLLARTLIERASQSTTPTPPERRERKPDEPEDAESGTRSGKLLRVSGGRVQVNATPETRRWRRQGELMLDPHTLAWLSDQMHPGDVFYDVGAGIGAYAMIAATQRGALAVAFEPGFATFSRLCDNLLLNGCYRSVVPLPTALSDKAGLFELRYAQTPGEHEHTLARRRWRSVEDGVESRYAQPICAERLDDAVTRFGLPSPHVIRISVRDGADRILRGAAQMLRQRQLRSVLVSVRELSDVPLVVKAMTGTDFVHTVFEKDGETDHPHAVRFVRSPDASRRGRLRSLRYRAGHILRDRLIRKTR